MSQRNIKGSKERMKQRKKKKKKERLKIKLLKDLRSKKQRNNDGRKIVTWKKENDE